LDELAVCLRIQGLQTATKGLHWPYRLRILGLLLCEGLLVLVLVLLLGVLLLQL
jgi:hypothetical protein